MNLLWSTAAVEGLGVVTEGAFFLKKSNCGKTAVPWGGFQFPGFAKINGVTLDQVEALFQSLYGGGDVGGGSYILEKKNNAKEMEKAVSGIAVVNFRATWIKRWVWWGIQGFRGPRPGRTAIFYIYLEKEILISKFSTWKPLLLVDVSHREPSSFRTWWKWNSQQWHGDCLVTVSDNKIIYQLASQINVFMELQSNEMCALSHQLSISFYWILTLYIYFIITVFVLLFFLKKIILSFQLLKLTF